MSTSPAAAASVCTTAMPQVSFHPEETRHQAWKGRKSTPPVPVKHLAEEPPNSGKGKAEFLLWSLEHPPSSLPLEMTASCLEYPTYPHPL